VYFDIFQCERFLRDFFLFLLVDDVVTIFPGCFKLILLNVQEYSTIFCVLIV
jgi:hypothetical protein